MKRARRMTRGRESMRALTIALALCMATGVVAGTSASFNGSTQNKNNKIGMASLTAPQALDADATGNSVTLTWGAGSFGGGTGFGHRVKQYSMGVEPGVRDGAEGPSDSCDTTDTFGTLTGRTNAATETYVSSGAGAASVAGSYICYRAETEYPATPSTAQWASQSSNPVTSLMVGHVVTKVTSFNGGTVGDIDAGDVINIDFNQAVNISTGPVSTNNQGGTPSSGHDVCVVSASGIINIGRTAIGTNCTATQAVSVGRITGLTMGPANETPGHHASYSWSNCPSTGNCKTLTVLIGARYRGNKTVYVSAAPSPSFEPTTTSTFLKSTSGAVQLCTAANTATATCRPVPTGTI